MPEAPPDAVALRGGVSGFLRDADWLTADRARAYGRILLSVTAIIAVAWVALSHGGNDVMGKPLGTDFIEFYTASHVALTDKPTSVFAIEALHDVEITLFGDAARDGYAPFFYPPTFLLLCLPLALLPYLPSLVAWMLATFVPYHLVVRRLLPAGSGVPIAAFPAVLVNLGHGQNGFLTAALFGGGMLALDRFPIVAGVCLGGLVVKPHLALLIPIGLLAARRWTAFVATGATALALIAASAIAFGTDTWRAYLATAGLAGAVLERMLDVNQKMPSIFAAVRLLGGGVTASYAAQAAFALMAVVVLVRVAWRHPNGRAVIATTAVATFLTTPYLFDYDLTTLALPLAFVFGEARARGFLPWEKIVLATGFILPLIARPIAIATAIPLGPPVLLAVFLVMVRRARAQAAAA